MITMTLISLQQHTGRGGESYFKQVFRKLHSYFSDFSEILSYSYNTGTRDVWHNYIALKHEGVSPEG